jgi:hypothetical protein
VLFGLDEERIEQCLNDYLWGNCVGTVVTVDVAYQGS